MASSLPKLASYADPLALQDDARGEVLGGDIVTAPVPLPQHSKVQRAAGRFLGSPFE
ncbi:MAG: hypothetical protein RLZZ450_1053 [Pseudomonadota bacterium]|jgi:hypothetical protein